MRRLWQLCFALAVTAALAISAGCGDEETERARLVVQQELPDGPVYIEGSVAFFQLWREDEEEPTCAGQKPELEDFACEVPAGEYSLVSYQRPCQGTARSLTRLGTAVRGK